MVASQFRTGTRWGAVGDGEKEFCYQVVGDFESQNEFCVLSIEQHFILGPPVWNIPRDCR